MPQELGGGGGGPDDLANQEKKKKKPAPGFNGGPATQPDASVATVQSAAQNSFKIKGVVGPKGPKPTDYTPTYDFGQGPAGTYGGINIDPTVKTFGDYGQQQNDLAALNQTGTGKVDYSAGYQRTSQERGYYQTQGDNFQKDVEASMRVNAFSHHFWVNHPVVAAHMMFSGISYKDTKYLGQVYEPVNRWAEQKTTLGGVSGALRHLYNKAINLPDPVQRYYAVRTAEAFLNLSPGDQQTAIAALTDPVSFGLKASDAQKQQVQQDISTATGGWYNTPWSQDITQTDTANARLAAHDATTDGSMPGAAGLPTQTTQAAGPNDANFLTVAPQKMAGQQVGPMPDADAAVAWGNLIPALKGKVFFDATRGTTQDDYGMSLYNAIQNAPLNPVTFYQRALGSVTGQDLTSHYDQNGQFVPGMGFNQQVTELNQHGVKGTAAIVASGAAIDLLKSGAVGGPAGAIMMNGAEFGDLANSLLPDAHGGGVLGEIHQLGGAAAYWSNGLYSGFQDAVGGGWTIPGTGVHVPGLAEASGFHDSPLNPDGTYKDQAQHDQYEQAVQRTGALGTLAIAWLFGHAGGMAKATGDMPEAQVAAQMGLATDAAGKVDISQSIVDKIKEGMPGKVSEFARVLKIPTSVASATLDSALLKVMGKTPEEFFSSRFGTQWLEHTASLVRDAANPDRALTEIQRHSMYQLDTKMVQAMVDTGGNVAEMRQIAIDHFTGRSAQTIRIQAHIDTQTAQRQVLGDGLSRLRDEVHTTLPPEVSGTPLDYAQRRAEQFRRESGSEEPVKASASDAIPGAEAVATRGEQVWRAPSEGGGFTAPVESEILFDSKVINGSWADVEARVNEINQKYGGVVREGDKTVHPMTATEYIDETLRHEMAHIEDLQATGGTSVLRKVDQLTESGKLRSAAPGEPLDSAYRYIEEGYKDNSFLRDGDITSPTEVELLKTMGENKLTVKGVADSINSQYARYNPRELLAEVKRAWREDPGSVPEPVAKWAQEKWGTLPRYGDTPSLRLDELRARAVNGDNSPELAQQIAVETEKYNHYLNASNALDTADAELAHMRQILADELGNLKMTEFRFPGRGGLAGKLHGILESPASDSERFWHQILTSEQRAKGWANRNLLPGTGLEFNTAAEPWIMRFTDKLSSTPSILNPFKEGAAPNTTRLNQTTIERVGHRLGWSADTINSEIERFRNATNDQEFFDASKAFEQTVSINLPKGVHFARRQLLTTFTKNSGDDFRARVPVYDTQGNMVGERPLLADASGQSIPSLTPEFMGDLHLSNIDLIDEAMSGMRRWSRRNQYSNYSDAEITSMATKERTITTQDANGKNVSQVLPDGATDRYGATSVDELARMIHDGNASSLRIVRGAATAYDMGRSMLLMGKAALMPLSLIFHIPSIIIKKTLDESLGNSQFFDMHGNLRSSEDMARGVALPDPATVGGGISSVFTDEAKGERIVHGVRTSAAVNTRTGAGDLAGLPASKARELEFLSHSPEMRHMLSTYDPATDTFDHQAMVDWLNSPENAPRLQGQLDHTGQNIDAYVTDMESSIRHATFNDRDLMALTRDGRLMTPGHGRPLSPAQADELDGIERQLQAVQDRIDQGGLGGGEKRALLDKRKELLNEEKIFARRTGKLQTFGQQKKLAGYIKDRLDSGTLKPDEFVSIDRYATENDASGIAERWRESANTFGERMYGHFRVIGKLEAKGARGAFFQQAVAREQRAYESIGMSKSDALAKATANAIDQTKDVFYGLNSRSTMERQLRSVFWFAPLTGEMLYRWFYAIPESKGLLPGLISNGLKAGAWFNILKSYNVIHQDPNGGWVMGIPGADSLAAHLGMHLNLDIHVASMTHIMPSAPQVTPVLGVTLSAAQRRWHNSILSDVNNTVNKFGGSIDVLPSTIADLAKGLGVPIPDINPTAREQHFAVVHDQALQYSYEDMQKAGDIQPQRQNFNSDAEFQKAWNDWFGRLNSKANHMTTTMLLFTALGSMVTPGSMALSNPDKDAFKAFWTNKILPQLKPGTAMSADTKAQLDTWLAEHPLSQAYAVSYQEYEDTGGPLPPDVTNDKYYQDQYLYGLKKTMDPHQYAYVLSAMTERQALDATRNAAIQNIAGNGDAKSQATNLLLHWGTRKQVMTDYNNKLNQYYTLVPPQLKDTVDSVMHNAAQAKGYTSQTQVQDYVTTALQGLSNLAPVMLGNNPKSNPEFTGTVRQLKTMLTGYYTPAVSNDPVAKTINQFFNQVIAPYMDKVQPLYTEANRMRDAGANASDVYAQIKQLNDQYSATAKKLGLPSIDKFFFGSQSKQEQTWTKLGWQSKPPTWLTEGQRQLAGYQTFKGDAQMWNQISDAQAKLATKLNDPNNYLSPSSKAYQAAQTQELNTEKNIAGKYGNAGLAAWQLSQQVPAVRIGHMSPNVLHNASWQAVMKDVQWANNAATSYGFSIKGSTQDSVTVRKWIAQSIIWYENNDPSFRRIMYDMSYALPGIRPGEPRIGLPLYDALFFGNFSPYEPQALTQQVTLPRGVS